ncbi:hypothetical protein GOV09_06230 [Candidatus Woesearchaeota archaeon]|nr:hypothetical protein [Candidatus Woesearchaeota archaeon]
MRKSQVWITDLTAGIIIFLFAIVIYFIYTDNLSNFGNENIDETYADAAALSDLLMKAGSPPNWDISTVKEIGLTGDDFRLNETKLTSLSSLDYSRSKLLLKTRYDFLFFFENNSNDVQTLAPGTYFGKPGVSKENINEVEDPFILITVKRLLIHDSDILTMVVYVWE